MEKEKGLMERCKAQLEDELPIRQLNASDEELKQLRTYQFLSMKPLILVVNVPEDRINDLSLMEEISREFSLPAVQISAEIEQEISNLEEKDRAEFMKEMGITESALDKMTTLAFSGLGLISFFTVGEDEVRAWPVRKGSSAPEAGSTIHSDIEKGFVRAEMFKYDELISAGSEAKLKEQGKFHLKGKDYIVEDGDILSFRFNV
jgi:ribosome-binding ATPase YchF (GTP1/OBG family)